MKMLGFKFNHNRPINEEFDLFELGVRGEAPGDKGAPIHRFLSRLLLVSI